MRVAYLNACGQMGGAETSLYELLKSVRRSNPSWDLHLVLGEDGPFRKKMEAENIPVTVLPFPAALAQFGDSGLRSGMPWGHLPFLAAATLTYLMRLRAALRSLRPDLIHATGFKMQILGLWAKPAKLPLLWHIHDYVQSRPLMRQLLSMHARHCAGAVVNSRSVGADFQGVCPDLDITPVYNAIDLERYSPRGSLLDLDSVCGLPPASPETVRIGLVGTFAKWKGHRIFLKALATAVTAAPIRGYVVGGPIYQTSGSQCTMQELAAESDAMGLRGKLGFTGFIDDTAAAMRALDIVVHASTQPEPFGMVIVEGMACGKAVIASLAGGAAEIVRDEENALAHLPGDAVTLAEQMILLANHPELRARLGNAGRQRAVELCEPRRLAQELSAVYASACGPLDRAIATVV